jgi:hypothetical protein
LVHRELTMKMVESFTDQILSSMYEGDIPNIVEVSEIQDLSQDGSIVEEKKRQESKEREKEKKELKRFIREEEVNSECDQKNSKKFKMDSIIPPYLTFPQKKFDNQTKMETPENPQPVSFQHESHQHQNPLPTQKIKGICFLKLDCTSHNVNKKIKLNTTSHCSQVTPEGRCTNGALFCCLECHDHLTYKKAKYHPILSVMKEQMVDYQNNEELKILFRRAPNSPKNDTGKWILTINRKKIEARVKSTKSTKDNEGSTLEEVIFTVEGLSSIIHGPGIYTSEIEFTRQGLFESKHPNVFNIKYN